MSEYSRRIRGGISVGIFEKLLLTFARPPDEMDLESCAPGSHPRSRMRPAKSSTTTVP